MQVEEADAEVAAQRVKAEGEKPVFDGEDAGVPAAEAKLLDASTLKPGESLAGRDLQGWRLQGDFSGRNFDGANLQHAVARCTNFRNASMRGVDASRADFRGASLAGVDCRGATLRRANCMLARMAGMWSGPRAETRPEVQANEDGTMPPVEPLEATDEQLCAAIESGIKAERDTKGAHWIKPVDEDNEDAQDEKAFAAQKHTMRNTKSRERFRDDKIANLVNMQHMNAR